MQLILLCAGRGSRLSKKNRSLPKSLIKINKKSILDYNKAFYSKFNNKVMITGYKNKMLNNFAKKNNFITVYNKDFKSTNMVHSLFLSSNYVYDDVVICYGDIIFSKNIFKSFAKKINIMPININWYDFWKKRMSKLKILDDAENIVIKDKSLISIGEKIKNKLPYGQYMGIFKLKKNDFFKLKNFFIKIKSKKIDMTSFLNLAIHNLNINFRIVKYSNYWFEIDTSHDLHIAKKELIKLKI